MSNGAYQTFTIYSTVGDETWDQISLKMYGAERYANVLMSANSIYQDIVFFDSGMVLIIPQLASVSSTEIMPWNLSYQYS
jgi:hypothetical protein